MQGLVIASLLAAFALSAAGDSGLLVDSEDSPKVCIANGCLRGKLMPGYQADSFEAFIGIPFAKPPIDSLRFENPQPYTEKWDNVYDAIEDKQACIQKNHFLQQPVVMGSEDCLYLNVYRPKIRSDRPYAVMVYIHGGGFFTGSATPLLTGPEYFMDNGNVILVVMQYRLGPFGMLSTGDEHSSGNFAFKDQALAIKWVHDNIEQFGGDPNMVTIFGQSAGAASTHLHIMSPLTRGLFKRAILMSGNGNAPYNYADPNPIDLARRQAQVAGIKNAQNLTSKKLVKALRSVDAKTLLDTGDKLKVWSVDPLTLFRPVVESENSPGAFMTEDPRDIWRKGNFTPVSWMATFVPQEGAVRASAILSNKALLDDLNSKFDQLVPKLLEMASDNPVLEQETLDAIVDKYLNGKHMIDDENKQGFINIYSDKSFIVPLFHTMSQYNKLKFASRYPAQILKFAFKGPYSYSVLFSGTFTDYGVVHCDDLIYLFRSPLIFPKDFAKDSLEAQMIKKMVDYYVDFAYHGSTSQDASNDKCGTTDYQSQMLPKYKYLEFSRSAANEIVEKVSGDVDYSIIKFWKRLDKLED